jgi:type II secretory pathway pseudopilin PulG
MRHSPPKRPGMTLLEVMAATTMMATLMASVFVLVRSSYAVWQAHEADMERAESAYATLRHIVRSVRQATGVAAISDASETSGHLSLMMGDGATLQWQHSGAGKEVFFGVVPTSADQLLAKGIDELSFVAYEADGVTATTVVEDIHALRCTLNVTMPAGGGTPRSVSSWAWLRSW